MTANEVLSQLKEMGSENTRRVLEKHEKIIAPEFTGIFADAVNSDRFNDRLLRTIFLWRCWSKHRNG